MAAPDVEQKEFPKIDRTTAKKIRDVQFVAERKIVALIASNFSLLTKC